MHLEERLGQQAVWAASRTTQEDKRVSEGKSERTMLLLSAWEIQRLADEDIVGFHRDLPPFRATRMDWRRFPLLVQRTTLPPPQLASLPELPPVCRRPSVQDSPFPECIDLDGRN